MEIGVRLRVGSVLAIAVFALTFLGACGGEGPALTTQEYAEAMEDVYATQQEDAEKHWEDFQRVFDDAFEEFDDRPAPPSDSSWSDEDAEFASEFAETILRAYTDLYEASLGVLEDYGDELSSLRPPAHLAELHNTMSEGIKEIVREIKDGRGDLKDIDTDIDNEAEFEEFWTSLDSIGDSDSGSWEQVEEACRELQASLEAELGANFTICD